MEDDENEEVINTFPGLYHQDATAFKSDSDCDSSSEKGNRKELLKQKKEKSRDIGYAALDAESSDEEMEVLDSKNPLKGKKKSFKFLKKKEKDDKEKKKEDKEDKKKEKEVKKKEKEEKRKIKKDKKKKVQRSEGTADGLPIFGVALSLAVERCPSHDGIKLPAIVRCCIDFVEDNGLSCEGIYRVGGVKSKVQSLRRSFNCGELVPLNDQQPHVVASLLKQFLRELPETVLTVDMMPHFEDVSLIPNPKERAEALRQLVDRLPTTNRLLLQYMLKHMGHVVEHEKDTKMSYQNVCVVLSPTMQISHRVLNVMFHSHKYLFGNVHIKKYVPPIMSSSESHRSVDELLAPSLIEEELNKQESLLASLHVAVASGRISHKTEEQLWEAQRIHTLLKRRLKMNEKKDTDSSGGQESSSEKLNFESERSFSSERRKSSPEMKMIQLPSSETASKLRRNSHKTEPKTPETKPQQPPPIASEIVPDEAKIDSVPVAKIESVVPKNKKDTYSVIPAIPKPVSVRAIRSKLAQETRDSADSSSIPSQPSAENNKSESEPPSEIIPLPPPVAVRRLPPENPPPQIKSTKKPVSAPPPVCNRRIKESDLEILRKEELRLEYEHEELLCSNQELSKKLKSEKTEIGRLKEEIQEMQTIYGYRTHSYDSSESEGSDSEGESDTEEDVVAQISAINKINEQVKNDNTNLVRKIHEEREAVIRLKVSLREAKLQSNWISVAS